MKTLIFYLVLLVAGTSQAQEITELKEAKVGFSSIYSDVDQDENRYSFTIKETYSGEFEKDPLAFMEANFDIQSFMDFTKDEEFDGYEVSFINRKGVLKANFNSNGELVRSSSRFKNIVLPEKLRSQLVKDHKGWTMTKNIHIARGKNGLVTKDYYKVKLENGKDRKRVILEAPLKGAAVAGN